MLRYISKFLKSEDGPTSVEYAVMLGLIIVVCVAGVTTVGNEASKTWDNNATIIDDAFSAAGVPD